MEGTISAKVKVTDAAILACRLSAPPSAKVIRRGRYGVRAGGRAVKRPLELAESHRQTAQRDVALGARIAQPLGLGGQMRRHRGQQVWLVEAEGLVQLQAKRAAGKLRVRQAKLEDRCGLAMEVAALGGGNQHQDPLERLLLRVRRRVRTSILRACEGNPI